MLHRSSRISESELATESWRGYRYSPDAAGSLDAFVDDASFSVELVVFSRSTNVDSLKSDLLQ